ncbi:hypothetical protein ACO22_07660, partial [Paracoccidioides brasiliensis]
MHVRGVLTIKDANHKIKHHKEELIKERNRALQSSVGIKVLKSNTNQLQCDVINESQSIEDSTRSN